MLKKIILAGAALAIIGVIALWPKISVYLAGSKTTKNSTVVYIPFRGGNLEDLAHQLVEAKVIEEVDAFLKVGEYKKLTQDRLAPGMYPIQPATNFRALLNGFTLNANGNGNAEVEVEVTFNNCRDIPELAGKVSKSLMVDSAELVETLTSEATLTRYDFSAEQLPALFLPNTYKMFWDTPAAAFLDRMATEFRNFWTADRKAKLAQVGLKTPSEAVTLASIVYSEQGKHASEWPIIAGLYLNRLNQGIRLQSDPTFKFCWGDRLKGVQRLTYEHRDIDCPYNTYYNDGLPPGPICIPPTAVVDAVLNRDNNEFIFMIAQPNYSGLHDFSKDYATHAKNAKIYQKWLAQQS